MATVPSDVRASAAAFVHSESVSTLRRCALLLGATSFSHLSNFNPYAPANAPEGVDIRRAFRRIPDVSMNPNALSEEDIERKVRWLVNHWFDDIIGARGVRLSVGDLKSRALVPDSRGFLHPLRGPCLCILHPSWYPLVVASAHRKVVAVKTARGRGQGHRFDAGAGNGLACKWSWYAREDMLGSANLQRGAKRPMITLRVDGVNLGDKIPMRLLFADRDNLEASHLCHNPICMNTGHVISETHFNNAARNGCCGPDYCLCSQRWICWRPGPYRVKADLDGE